jgi:hypothetical protein
LPICDCCLKFHNFLAFWRGGGGWEFFKEFCIPFVDSILIVSHLWRIFIVN